MFTLSNAISLLRVPLAFLYLVPNVVVRASAILLSCISDCVDGYLARRNHTITKTGTILDPAADKFFVYFVLAILFVEHKIVLWEALSVISRDFALCVFALYLTLFRKWKLIKCQAIKWGKVATALQFLVLFALTVNLHVPTFVYVLFIVLGVLALIELFLFLKKIIPYP